MRDLVKHYAGYYGDPVLREWRDLGGREKAFNIVSLWGRPELPQRVAEIGFGEGAVLAHLDRSGFGNSFTGFEVSSSAVQAASQRQFCHPIRFVKFDGRRIPARDDEFDLAILSHVLEHVAEPRVLLEEAARIAPAVFVEVPTELHARTPKHFGWTDVGHINLYSPLVIRHLVESCGLRVVAERVTQPSRETCSFHTGAARGTAKWLVKSAALKARIGTRMFTYHSCLLAVRGAQ